MAVAHLVHIQYSMVPTQQKSPSVTQSCVHKWTLQHGEALKQGR